MCSFIRILINVVKTCKKAFCVCRKSKRRTTVFGPQQSERTRHVINAATVASSDIPQEASSLVTINLSEETAVISSVHQETAPTSADISHTDVYDEKLQSKTRTKKVRCKKVKSWLNTEDVLLADESGPATENTVDITLNSCSNNEEEPCTSQTMVVSEQKDEAEDMEFWRIIENIRKKREGDSDKVSCVKEQQSVNKSNRTSSKRTEISISSRCETDHENKSTDASNKSRGNTVISKSSEHKKSLAKKLRQKTTVQPGAEKLLPVKVNENGSPTDVSRSNNEKEPSNNLSGMMVVGERAEDAEEVSGHGRIVVKPRKQRVDQSGDAPCVKEQLRVNKPDRITSCHTRKSSSVKFDSVEHTMMVEEKCIKMNKSTKIQAVVLRTSRALLNKDCKTRQKYDVSRASRKAKRVRFLVNGDRFYKGVVVAVTHERYRSFDSLLAELSNALSENKHLSSGVRKLFSTEGRKISQLEDLEDGKFYICSSGNNFIKNIDYTALNNVKPSQPLNKLQSTNNVLISPSKQLPLNIRSKIIFVVRCGTRPRKIIRMLLNKCNSPSFEHVLTLISKSVKLDTGVVRKVYISSGCQIMQLEQFFGPEDLFFAYGPVRISRDDLKLDFKEIKIVQSYKRELKMPANELKNGTYCMDESNRRVPQSSETITANQNITSSVPSKILNKYTIGDRLGDGNFAVVYRCFDKRSNSEYALKVIKKIETPQMDQMIKNELSILKPLNHPNIIRLISELVTPTDVYLITELVSGGDLFEAIDRGTEFSVRDNRLMTKNLASALAYLHGMDIVHRDVKPENLLVEFDSDGRVLHVKLADFGLSQKVIKPLYAMCGTPMYIAPEILTQEGYGVKIDVWAAGVILYILLCGFPPFVSENDNQEQLLDNIRIGTYGFPEPYWNNVSEEAKNLVCSMLQSNPSLRYSAKDVLDHPWCDEYEL